MENSQPESTITRNSRRSETNNCTCNECQAEEYRRLVDKGIYPWTKITNNFPWFLDRPSNSALYRDYQITIQKHWSKQLRKEKTCIQRAPQDLQANIEAPSLRKQDIFKYRQSIFLRKLLTSRAFLFAAHKKQEGCKTSILLVVNKLLISTKRKRWKMLTS